MKNLSSFIPSNGFSELDDWDCVQSYSRDSCMICNYNCWDFLNMQFA
jgi:hypothetical protein